MTNKTNTHDPDISRNIYWLLSHCHTRDRFSAEDGKKLLALLDQSPDLETISATGSNLFGAILELLSDCSAGVDAEAATAVVSWFLDHKAPYQCSYKSNPLLTASSNNLPTEIFHLLENHPSADLNGTDIEGDSLFLHCSKLGNIDIFKYLLAHPKVDIFAKNNDGENALHLILKRSRSPEVIENLLQRGFDINETNKAGKTPLALLCDVKIGSDGPSRIMETIIEEACKVALYAISKGALVDPAHPEANIPVIIDAKLGFYPGHGKGVELFDRIVGEVKHLDNKLSRRIPKQDNSEEFIAFVDVVAKAHAFAKALDPNHPKQISVLLADMLERTQGSWVNVRDSLKEFSTDDCHDVKDAIRGFAETVVLPEIVQRTKRRAEFIDYNKALDKILPEVARVIVGDRSLASMLRLSKDWHRPERYAAIENSRTIKRTGSWEKAAVDFTASNGYLVTFLETADKLEKEGRNLHHCVGGYVENCKKDTHIASIRKPAEHAGDEPVAVATVEFSETPKDKSPLKIMQRRGDCDATVPSDSPEMQALNEFMGKIHADYKGADKITIDFDRIKKRREKIKETESADDISAVIGYDPHAKNAPDMQDKFFGLYMDINSGAGQTASFIPGGISRWRDKNALDFLEEAGLQQKIERLCENPPLRDRDQTSARRGG